jgi:adenine-specific DNA-methyltransferase
MDALVEKIQNLSIDYTKQTDVKYLKQHGQYFTVEHNILDKLLNDYKPHHQNNLKILEPACGTGCIIGECLKHIPNCTIHGIDIDHSIVEKSKGIFASINNVTIKQGNFLTQNLSETYDLIIGNPPYFEIPASKIDKEMYAEVMCGRTNIYTLFIYKCIQQLNDGGELRFVIPRTMLSGKYFSKLRTYIHKECEILDIVKFEQSNLFSKALQSVIILKLKKRSAQHNTTQNDKHVLHIKGNLYFTSDTTRIIIDETTTTIRELGCIVKTGSILWNQHKNNLHSEMKDNLTLPLVMASNIKNNTLLLTTHVSTHAKKQYLSITNENKKYIETGPFILTNRIVGICPPKLNSVLISEQSRYFIENHVNIIKGPLKALETIQNSLQQNHTTQFIQELMGSTQLSQWELENVVPIKQ